MTKLRYYIFFDGDPSRFSLGGTENFIEGIIKGSPIEWEIILVCFAIKDSMLSINKFNKIILFDRAIEAFPIMKFNTTTRHKIPLTLMFTIYLLVKRKLLKIDNNVIISFHRIEHLIPFYFYKNKMFLFIHSNSAEINTNRQSDSFWKKLPSLYFILENILLKRFKKIFVIGNESYLQMSRRYEKISQRMISCKTWYDENIFYVRPKDVLNNNRIDVNSKYGIQPNSKIILFVGRLEQVKNPILALKIVRSLVDKFNDFTTLIIIGIGSLKKEISFQVEKMSLTSNIIFAGQLERHELSKLMSCSDILLMTSHTEGMPFTLLEALACGLPVITTKVGDSSTIIRNKVNGEVIDSFYCEDFVDSLIYFLSKENNRNEISKTVLNYKSEIVIQEIVANHQ